MPETEADDNRIPDKKSGGIPMGRVWQKVILAAILCGGFAALMWGSSDELPENQKSTPVVTMNQKQPKPRQKSKAVEPIVAQTKAPTSFMDQYKNVKHDKWIVLTTIQAPTDQVRTLATIPGWKLLVIGDKKTPEPWSLPNVIYIGAKDQEQMGYNILKYISFNRYTRKSIGHLFAIQHGAQMIYETDDDNVPTVGLENFFVNREQMSCMVVKTDLITYNPCRHFGQSTLWPRGFPLDLIGRTDPRDYWLSTVNTPPIQQGFVNGDPDMDAIFRLSRKYNDKPLDLKFDMAAPPVLLPPGTFAPMNSQNTLYLKNALWAMILPTSVTDRVCDIYRAYWSERLLWLIGEMVAFFPPNAYQARSPHSYIGDAMLEVEMYKSTLKLLDFMKSWTCKHSTLPACAIQITEEIADHGFWGELDVDLVIAWIQDLSDVGYEFPPLAEPPKPSVNANQMVYYPSEQLTSWMYPDYFMPEILTNANDMENVIVSTCQLTKPLHYQKVLTKNAIFTDVVLVVGLHDPKNALMIDAVHRVHFPNIIYCGKHDPKFFHGQNSTYLPMDSPSGFKCLEMAASMKHLVSGYLYMPDNIQMVGKNFGVGDFKDVPLIPKDLLAPKAIQDDKNPAPGKISACVSDRLKQTSTLQDQPIYLPRKLRNIFADIRKGYGSGDSSVLENVLPLLVGCSNGNALPLTQSTVEAGGAVHYISPFVYQFDDKTTQFKTSVCNFFQSFV